MWPWDHLVFGYLLYAVVVRVTDRDPPGDLQALVVAVATQLPDLIDKPLGWLLGVLPSGRSLGHSLPVFVVLLVGVAWLDRRVGGRPATTGRHGRVTLAFAVAFVSHLAGDVLYPVAVGGPFAPQFLLWPFLAVPAAPVDSASGHLLVLWEQYVQVMTSSAGGLALAFEAVFLAAGAAVWLSDGAPGAPPSLRRRLPVRARE
jgi:hypothetical protein